RPRPPVDARERVARDARQRFIAPPRTWGGNQSVTRGRPSADFRRIVHVRRYLGVAVLIALAACGSKKTDAPAIRTAAVSRRDIIVDAQANGTIEPIEIVEVKSKA